MDLARLLDDSVVYRRTAAGERALQMPGMAHRHARVLAWASGFIDLRTLLDLAATDGTDLPELILELLRLGWMAEVANSQGQRMRRPA